MASEEELVKLDYENTIVKNFKKNYKMGVSVCCGCLIYFKGKNKEIKVITIKSKMKD